MGRSEKESRINILTEKIDIAKKTIEELEVKVYNLRERDEELREKREVVRVRRDDENEAIVRSDANKINQELSGLPFFTLLFGSYVLKRIIIQKRIH